MSTTYYIAHPNMEVSARVVAPTTEKARTTFLDWLERTNRIGRADRQTWRRNMVAERLEYPDDVIADIDLKYAFKPDPFEGSADFMHQPAERVPRVVEDSYGEEEEEVETEPVEEPKPPKRERRLSPIQKLALGGQVE